jgi:16S rRNA processing protein RimM
MNGDALLIGKIARPHGVRGELKVKLFFDGSDSLANVTSVVLKGPKGASKEYEVEAVRGSQKSPILALVGVESRELAEAIKDWDIWVERAALPPLKPGEYYLIDVVGCDVFVMDKPLGRVIQVRPDPSVDTIVIEDASGKVLEQPLLPHFVGKVDVQARRVELLSEDGIID